MVSYSDTRTQAQDRFLMVYLPDSLTGGMTQHKEDHLNKRSAWGMRLRGRLDDRWAVEPCATKTKCSAALAFSLKL